MKLKRLRDSEGRLLCHTCGLPLTRTVQVYECAVSKDGKRFKVRICGKCYEIARKQND